jgi:hypothetical protein
MAYKGFVVNTETPERHTPKNVDADGNSTIASSYIIDEMMLINENGEEEKHFYKLVSSIKIIEELFSPVIICKVSIKDDVNFFQNFKINGKEILKLKLLKDIEGESQPESIDLTLVTKEYPNYSKSTDGIHIQEYDIVFVTPFAYFSKIQNFSQSVEGNIFDIIKDLYRTKLGVEYENIDIEGVCPHKIKTVITKQTPLQAISWILSKAVSTEDGAFDELNYSPFLMWQSINAKDKDKILIKPWYKIINNKVKSDRRYTYKKYFEGEPGTKEYQKDVLRTIISFSSNLKLNKLEQILNGGYGSQLNVFEYDRFNAAGDAQATNMFIPAEELNDEKYSLEKFKNAINDALPKSKGSKNSFINLIESVTGAISVPEKTFTSKGIAENRDIYLHKPFPLYHELPNDVLTTIDVKERYKQKELFLKALSDNISHSCSLYGDFNLNPGKKITIQIPVSIGEDIDETEIAGTLDSDLSGDYIISTAVHIFKNGEYTTKLRLIKPLQTKKVN